jgi:hypothetical protein
MIYCSADGSFIMTHPGLPESWGLAILALMLLTLVWTVRTPLAVPGAGRPVLRLPLIGSGVKAVGPGLLLALKLVTVSLFLLVIAAGLFGTPIPEKNLATVLTWNLWWAGAGVFDLLPGLDLVRGLSLGCAGAVAGQTKDLGPRRTQQFPQSRGAARAAWRMAGPGAARRPDLARNLAWGSPSTPTPRPCWRSLSWCWPRPRSRCSGARRFATTSARWGAPWGPMRNWRRWNCAPSTPTFAPAARPWIATTATMRWNRAPPVW